MPASLYMRNLQVRILRGVSVSVTPYVSLHTADPGATGLFELSALPDDRSYARLLAGFAAEAGGQVTNAADIIFPDLPTATILYAGFWDSPTGGNWLGYEHVNSPGGDPVTAGQSYRIAAGSMNWVAPT